MAGFMPKDFNWNALGSLISGAGAGMAQGNPVVGALNQFNQGNLAAGSLAKGVGEVDAMTQAIQQALGSGGKMSMDQNGLKMQMPLGGNGPATGNGPQQGGTSNVPMTQPLAQPQVGQAPGQAPQSSGLGDLFKMLFGGQQSQQSPGQSGLDLGQLMATPNPL